MPRPVKQTPKDPGKTRSQVKTKRNSSKTPNFFEDNPGNVDEENIGPGGVMDLGFESDDSILNDEPDDQSLSAAIAETGDLLAAEALEEISASNAVMELSEDPVRLYLKRSAKFIYLMRIVNSGWQQGSKQSGLLMPFGKNVRLIVTQIRSMPMYMIVFMMSCSHIGNAGKRMQNVWGLVHRNLPSSLQKPKSCDCSGRMMTHLI